MPPSVALSLQDIHVRFGNAPAVRGVSLEVRRGEVVGLLGPNGSGKSTTLAVAAGVLSPAMGTVSVDGIRRDHDPIRFATQVGLVPQDCALYEEMTAAENLAFFGELYGFDGSELRRRIIRTLTRFRLVDRANVRVGTLSGGLKQRLNLAAALLHDPPVLLLDEPTASLDSASRDALLADLAQLKDDGHAVLLSTHHLDEAELCCDRVAVLERGRLATLGKPGDLLRTRPASGPVLFGHLGSRLPKFQERAIRGRLGPGVRLEITGRRLRLAARSTEELGQALALVLAEGVDVASLHTPTGSLERALIAPDGAAA